MDYRFRGVRSSPISLQRESITWIGALFAAKTADAVTTYFGHQSGLREVNPIPAAIFEMIGVLPGIFFVTTFSMLVVVGGIELWVTISRRLGMKDRFVPWLRASWYLFAVFVHLTIAADNASLILG